jgi:ferric-dicitrate binding protein FerR (iron transport regulator)
MQRINYLLAQYLAGKASTEEVQEMLRWLRENPDNESLLQQAWESHPGEAPAPDLRRMWANIEMATEGKSGDDAADDGAGKVRSIPGRYRWGAVAAAAVLVIATGVWLFYPRNNQKVAMRAEERPFIAPGMTGAILTLADGRHISLDSAGKGVIATQNGSQAVYGNTGVEYHATGKTGTEMVYNTIATPRGRQFHFQLPDGSQVWLNAASSIRFPTAFDGAGRRVQVTGEAYLEIARNKDLPFVVESPHAVIDVLGTSFNINAYSEEEVEKVTLLSGSISTAVQGQKIVLKPGQQSQVMSGNKMQVRDGVDTDQAIAWKNGAFNFQNMRLREVLRQLARWYDLDIVYEKEIPNVSFGGEMSRNVPLSELLDGLKDMGIHFRIEANRKLIVTP